MPWAEIILSLVFVISAAFLLNISNGSRWSTGFRLNFLRESRLSGVVLPPRPSFRRRKNTPSTSRISYAATAFTRDRALRSFSRYNILARNELSSKYKNVNTLRGRHARIADEIGYMSKLDRLSAAIDLNDKVARAVTQFAMLEDRSSIPEVDKISMYRTSAWADDGPTDLARVVEALKHCIRDWSVDGLDERNRVFAPIIDVLRRVPFGKRKNTKVLVPGAGLGRLAWEIARMGFDVTANEVSSYMTLPLKMLLDEAATPASNSHTVCPHSSWFSHTRSNETLFQSASFPDCLPRVDIDGMLTDCPETENIQLHGTGILYAPSGKFELLESDFLSLTPPSRDEQPHPLDSHGVLQNGLPVIVPSMPRDRGYDFVVTLFFIDTATNILAYLDQIYALLRSRSPAFSTNEPLPNAGTWINLGPLLWPSGAALEPSLEEVLAMSKRVGLDIASEPRNLALLDKNQDSCDGGETVDVVEARKTLECQYTANRAGMMKWMYQAEFWVARRRED